MVIGMTCQTADVNIASSRMRYLVMVQGMMAFIFNATLLAMAINIISGVVALNWCKSLELHLEKSLISLKAWLSNQNAGSLISAKEEFENFLRQCLDAI